MSDKSPEFDQEKFDAKYPVEPSGTELPSGFPADYLPAQNTDEPLDQTGMIPDEAVKVGGPVERADLAAEETVNRQELAQAMESALGSLTDRQQKVLRLRYGIGNDQPLGLAETGRELGVSGNRVSQIESAAFEKLRQASKGLRDFKDKPDSTSSLYMADYDNNRRAEKVKSNRELLEQGIDPDDPHQLRAKPQSKPKPDPTLEGYEPPARPKDAA